MDSGKTNRSSFSVIRKGDMFFNHKVRKGKTKVTKGLLKVLQFFQSVQSLVFGSAAAHSALCWVFRIRGNPNPENFPSMRQFKTAFFVVLYLKSFFRFHLLRYRCTFRIQH